VNRKFVRIHRAPHLLCCRVLEVQKVVCAPDALNLRHPVNAHNLGGIKRIGLCKPVNGYGNFTMQIQPWLMLSCNC
jgi:hypothetical protein